jgi:peptide/nickel transport system permease protein
MKRLAQLVPILIVVSALVFFLVRLTPSDPVASITSGRKISVETRAALERQYHLDKPLPEQYLLWLGGALRGDLGYSFRYRQSVGSLLAARFPTTIQLVLMAAVFAVLLAVPFGVIAAVQKDTVIDRVLSGFMVFCVSSPPFLNAIVLMLIFALRFPIFPAFGAGHGVLQNCYYLALPAFALSLNMVALIGRIARDRMVGELKSSYALALRAEGLRRSGIVMGHCLKNALIPVITVAGIQIGSMVVGAVLVENVFALGGVGGLLVEAIKGSDYPIVQSVIMILVVVFLLLNMIVDLVYALLDPRIRAASLGGRLARA